MSLATDALRPLPTRAAARKTMSLTQTYYLAHKARAKLSREAAQPDHQLRLLVGHANLLDSLMLELADAEREQERWFNQSVRGAKKTPQRRIQWADRIVEEESDGDYESDSDSDSDAAAAAAAAYGDDDMDFVPAATPAIPLHHKQEEPMNDDLEEDYAQLELVRTPSHSGSPPELLLDHDSDSDDESMPPSPADASLPYDAMETKESQSEQHPFYQDEYYVSRRNPAALVSAISVY